MSRLQEKNRFCHRCPTRCLPRFHSSAYCECACPVDPARRQPERLLRRRDGHQMNMIRHQAPGQDLDLVAVQVVAKNAQIKLPIGGGKEHILAIVPALRDVVGKARLNEAGSAEAWGLVGWGWEDSQKKCVCPLSALSGGRERWSDGIVYKRRHECRRGTPRGARHVRYHSPLKCAWFGRQRPVHNGRLIESSNFLNRGSPRRPSKRGSTVKNATRGERSRTAVSSSSNVLVLSPRP